MLAAGAPLGKARGAMIMLHGRGASAADIVGIAQAIDRPAIAYRAPEAAGHVWYPNPFMTDAAGNEPWLSSAKGVIARLLAEMNEAGMPNERIAILGFSQGACLTLEYVARNPRRYGAVFALSGGLIGDRIEPANYPGSLDGTPVFVGCSDVDPFVPLPRVKESVAVMRHLNAAVTAQIYPGAAHTIVADEIVEVQRIVDAMIGA